jgi:formate hydrogenlyase transcriptional activator
MSKSAHAMDYDGASTVQDEPTLGSFQAEDYRRRRAGEMIGDSAKLQDVFQQVGIVGPTDSTVLITGETGTGKGCVAAMIHRLSERNRHPFVKVNCAAIPLGLLESELFGHERGAFTGAIGHRIGRFELANKGTIFLDEIGDIPPELQPKLLRVLQDHEFERLGSTHTIRTDVRVIAATHQNIRQMVKDSRFRMDLFYRLNVFPITVPPLRDRRGDIASLLRHFVAAFAQRMNKRIEVIPTEAIASFVRYPWPGNIRELENFVERAVILSHGAVLQAPLDELALLQEESASDPVTLKDAERAHILRTFRQTNGVIATTASRLGLPRSTLFYKLRRLGITTPHTQQVQDRSEAKAARA